MHRYDAATGESEINSTTWGTGIGAASGAILGQLIGRDSKSTAIGAAVGGAVGAGIGYSLDKQEADLRKELVNTGVQVQRNGNQIKLIMRDQIAFPTNQYQLQAGIMPALKSVANVLDRYSKTNLNISGFTDNTGSASYNMLLSRNRAQSVADYLNKKGVKATRIQVVGYGEENPVCNNGTADGRACNRRVEIILVSST